MNLSTPRLKASLTTRLSTTRSPSSPPSSPCYIATPTHGCACYRHADAGLQGVCAGYTGLATRGSALRTSQEEALSCKNATRTPAPTHHPLHHDISFRMCTVLWTECGWEKPGVGYNGAAIDPHYIGSQAMSTEPPKERKWQCTVLLCAHTQTASPTHMRINTHCCRSYIVVGRGEPPSGT